MSVAQCTLLAFLRCHLCRLLGGTCNWELVSLALQGWPVFLVHILCCYQTNISLFCVDITINRSSHLLITEVQDKNVLRFFLLWRCLGFGRTSGIVATNDDRITFCSLANASTSAINPADGNHIAFYSLGLVNYNPLDPCRRFARWEVGRPLVIDSTIDIHLLGLLHDRCPPEEGRQ